MRNLLELFKLFVNGKPVRHRLRSLKDYPSSSPESDALSKDLKARGFKFVGSAILYAHMQATGLVNDHSVECYLAPRDEKTRPVRGRVHT